MLQVVYAYAKMVSSEMFVKRCGVASDSVEIMKSREEP
jgi:hypothetical protein